LPPDEVAALQDALWRLIIAQGPIRVELEKHGSPSLENFRIQRAIVAELFGRFGSFERADNARS
jgi:hypothetical protein